MGCGDVGYGCGVGCGCDAGYGSCCGYGSWWHRVGKRGAWTEGNAQNSNGVGSRLRQETQRKMHVTGKTYHANLCFLETSAHHAQVEDSHPARLPTRRRGTMWRIPQWRALVHTGTRVPGVKCSARAACARVVETHARRGVHTRILCDTGTAVEKPLFGSIDQGTSSSRFVLYDARLQPLVSSQVCHAACGRGVRGWLSLTPVASCSA